MDLRPYQKQAVDAIFEQFALHDATLLVLPTGCGKTIVFSHAIKQMIERTGKRALVMAHREELVFQAADKIAAILGERPDIEMAEQRANEHSMHGKARVVVASKDTIRTDKRLTRFNPDEFALLVTDEAHHAVARSYRKVYDHFHRNAELRHLGVTATPDRTDEKALGKVFKSCAFEYGINDGINDGWLVPIRQTSVSVESLDYSHVRTTAGDLNGADLAAILEAEQNVHRIAAPTVEIAGKRKTLIFAHTLKQAEQLCDVLNRHNPDCARWVSGDTPKDTRRYTLQNYKGGHFQHLINVGVFTEGFDEPTVECVVLARPTKSRSLFSQMVGRGTRPLPGMVDAAAGDDNTLFDGQITDDATARRNAIAASSKPYLEVIDFVGNSGKHKLVSVSDVLGGNYSDDVVERARKAIEKAGRTADVAEELAKAEHDIHEQKRKEQERRRQITAKAQYRTTSIDPFDILDLTPWRERAYEAGEMASEKQANLIYKMTSGKVDGSQLTKRKAMQLITELMNRRKQGRCSFGQARILQQYGYSPDVTFAEAKEIIDSIAQTHWKRGRTEQPVETFNGF